MTKQELLKCFTDKLRQQLATMTEAAKNTHKAATGEESKQEGKYDTRGLEASYLAEAQAQQTQLLTESLHLFETIIIDDSQAGEPIAPGTLVETECAGLISYYLLTPCAGGMSLEYDGAELTTLSPDAPLYQKLLGLKPGTLIESIDTVVLDTY